MDSRRRTYAILIGVILLTVPCYCAGVVALILAPDETAVIPTITPTATITATNTQLPAPNPLTAVPTNNPTITPGATETLPPTPGQFETETPIPSQTPTFTHTPTPTLISTETATATATPTPTATPLPTAEVWRPGDTVQVAAVQLQDTAQNTADAAIYNSIVCGPWLLLFLLIGLPGWRLARRLGVLEKAQQHVTSRHNRHDLSTLIVGRDEIIEEENDEEE